LSAAVPAEPDAPTLLALFCDATETVFGIAERRHADDTSAPAAPRRCFVRDADEAHRRALDGANPIVGMSLDDLLTCATSDHPRAHDLVAIAGVHRGFLQLVVQPDVTRIADLRHRRVAVDTDTGYASALFEILARHGLEHPRDFDVVYAGATNLRYDKLRQGQFEGTLLGAPFTVQARRRGYRALVSVAEALGGYQAVVLVASRPWLDAHPAHARAVSDCLLDTIGWASDPANAGAVAALLAEVLGNHADPEEVAEVADALFGASSEFLPDGRMRREDTDVVVDLFSAARGKRLSPAVLDGLVDARCL
jgi:ABC-type nitrate/sulfonate/bicarbonate transport system substrate-binding protein